MTFRVSTWPDGHRTWWLDFDTIPVDHTDIRPANEQEAKVIGSIMRHERAGRSAPSSLGDKIRALLAQS
jgi:hypothetical protein